MGWTIIYDSNGRAFKFHDGYDVFLGKALLPDLLRKCVMAMSLFAGNVTITGDFKVVLCIF